MQGRIDLKTEGMKLLNAERMPLAAGAALAIHPTFGDGTISIEYNESPVFLRWNAGQAAK